MYDYVVLIYSGCLDFIRLCRILAEKPHTWRGHLILGGNILYVLEVRMIKLTDAEKCEEHVVDWYHLRRKEKNKGTL